MNQQKVGQFLKELRSQKALTQEQLAEKLGVSNRSISRWENGVTMPDFDLLIQMAKFYDVEIGEILDGERKHENMDKPTEETLFKIADYNNTEKEFFRKRIHGVCIAGFVGMMVYMGIDLFGCMDKQPYAAIVDIVIGLVIGALLTGIIFTSRYGARIRAAKKRLWKRITHGGQDA